MKKLAEFYGKSTEWLWYGLILLLPITSLPLVAKLSRSENVAPASGIFLILLVLVWLIPYVIKKGTLPSIAKPFLFFILAAALSTGLSFFIANNGYKTISSLQSVLKGAVTLLIGCGFYLLASAFIKSDQIIRNTFRCINISGLILIGWCGLQAYYWYRMHDYPLWMKQLQDLLSTGVLFDGRMTGFALEPSWLAHQVNMLYLPYWLAALSSSSPAK